MRVVIIEDERPAAVRLKKMVAKVRPEWEVVTLPGIIDECVIWFSEHEHPDLIFLDIHLMDGNAFNFIDEAKPNSLIIFVTAYDEYALKAFSVNSIDYLLKPVKKDRLQQAITKFEGIYDSVEKIDHEQALQNICNALTNISSNNTPTKKFRTRILVNANGQFITLLIQDIAYFYTENKVTSAVLKTGQIYAIDQSLNKLEEELDGDLFFRVNRQILVSAEAIVKLEPYFLNKVTVQVNPPYSSIIKVSRDKVAALKDWLNF